MYVCLCLSVPLFTFALWSLIASILQRLSYYITLLLALPFCSSSTKPFWRLIIFCCRFVVFAFLFFLSFNFWFFIPLFFAPVFCYCCVFFINIFCFHSKTLKDTYTIHIHGTRYTMLSLFYVAVLGSVLFPATVKWLTLFPPYSKKERRKAILICSARFCVWFMVDFIWFEQKEDAHQQKKWLERRMDAQNVSEKDDGYKGSNFHTTTKRTMPSGRRTIVNSLEWESVSKMWIKSEK